MIRIDSAVFLKDIDADYFSNNQLTSFDIYARRFELPKDPNFYMNVTRVRFLNCRLEEIPNDLKNYHELTVIDLCDNRIKKIPDDYFSAFPRLSLLDLSSNFLTKLDCPLPETLTSLNVSYNPNFDLNSIWSQNLPLLNTLKASFCNIETLPSSTPVFKNALAVLYLDGNRFTAYPNEIKMFELLEELSLFGNEIEKVNDLDFKNPLKSFNISYNNINEITFSERSAIHSLTFSSNCIVDFPISFLQISDLKALTLTRLGLKGTIDIQIPPSIIGIDLSHNDIEYLSEKFISSTNSLMALNISYNKIKEFPDSFPENCRISRFFADHNQIEVLPPSFSKILIMEQFSIQNNKIRQIDPFKWAKLKNFNISFNKLTEIPDCFSNSALLLEINVSFNQLENLPVSLSSCRKVTSLIAAGNKFKLVPRCVMAFSQLKTLSLSRNELTTLPNGFGSFFFLRFLDLSNNYFQDFPSQILGIKALKFLSLSHNTISEIPTVLPLPPALQLLDLSFNRISSVPLTLPNTLVSLNLDYNKISEFDFTQLKNLQFLALSCNEMQQPLLDVMPTLLQNNPNLSHFEYLANEDKPLPEMPFKIHILDNARCKVSKRFSVGYSATLGDRPTMEDAVAFETFDNHHALFAVCDGHSGSVAAATVAKCLCCEFALIKEKCKGNITQVCQMIPQSFTKINGYLKSMKIMDGCTAAVVYISGNMVYASGIGDSRVVRVRAKSHQRMTVDFKPLNRSEYDRLKGEGLKVSSDGRINKKLAVARALGDFWCDEGLYVPPEVQKYCLVGFARVQNVIRKNSIKRNSSNASASNTNSNNTSNSTDNNYGSNKSSNSTNENNNESNNNDNNFGSNKSSNSNIESNYGSSSTSTNSNNASSTSNSTNTSHSNDNSNSNNSNSNSNNNSDNNSNNNSSDSSNNANSESSAYGSNKSSNTSDGSNNETDDDIGFIIACDGLWDVVDDSTAAEIVRNSKTGADAAVQLKNIAFGLQSKDNISVVVVLFKPKPEHAGFCPINTVELVPKQFDPNDDDEDITLPQLPGRRRR
ncbi:hypothetical protein TRFO_12703 [Tritrichomonas foetus]|uniref:PPM-type phosphatase domain-containing protein n=1 Tax=Tritrichomonas foetus TaxID=1144522 RepID=A0A1J4L0I7_9EUKA|nr:hypothetical protein TRFO_12703 [Tritrichomonas foetus]|eukprot:OHT17015.1 hypothetical protein TRFO_12703 [Tritrichomonas foetus]